MHDLRYKELACITLTVKVTPLKYLFSIAFMLPYMPSIYSPCRIIAYIVGMYNVSQVRKPVTIQAVSSE